MIKKVLVICIYLSQICISWGNDFYREECYKSLLQNLAFNRFPQEKVYLHMDNRSYFVGDTIWFKAYVMNASTLHPTQLSGVLYVELLNEKGVEMERKKMRLENGMCHGDFILKEDFRTGYYEIRAYTRYMLNFGNSASEEQDLIYEQMDVSERDRVEYSYRRQQEDKDLIPEYNHSIFSRVFPVYMPPQQKGDYKRDMEYYPFHTSLAFPKETQTEFREDNLVLSFYPEGGHIVAGVENVVAFEAVNQWGKKVEVEGYIAERKGEKITMFRTCSHGRGTFAITPQRETAYTAHVFYKGKNYKFKLPQSIESGVSLHLQPPVSNEDVNIELRPSNARETELLGVSVQCRGSLLAFDTITVNGGITSFVKIPWKALRTGVNQFTLFNARGEILADRLFFVLPPKQQTKLTITNLPDSVNPYEQVTLELQASNSTWSTQSIFSIAVTDADNRDTSFDTRDIRSELLLSSDLKGFIEDADSYFRHENDTLMATDLDLLMLVQGWRRYEWKPVGEVEYTPEKGLQLDGYVISDIVKEKSIRNPDNYKRIPNLTMKVLMQSPRVSFRDSCLVDSSGRFHLNINRYFIGEVPMTLELSERDTDKQKKWHQWIIPSDMDLRYSYPVIHRVFSPLPNMYSYYQIHTPEDELLLSSIGDSNWAMEGTIEEVIVKKRFKQKSEIHYENPDMIINYFKEWNHVIDRGCPLMNYNGGTNENNTVLLNYHLGRMRLSQGEEMLRKYDSIYVRQAPRFYKPYHMPDTIKVYTNLCSREQLNIRELDANTDHRDMLRCVFTYFKRSESPRNAPYMPKNGVRDTYYEGYSQVRSFYSPDYSECALPDTADYRRTLYWNPDVWTDHRGRTSVSFYNNKRTKKLHVRAEGFTRNGEFIVYDSDKPTN